MLDAYLESLIVAHFPCAKLRGKEKLTGGVSASVTLLDVELADHRAKKLVLREHGPSHCGHPIDLEFQLLRSLNDFGLAVPKPLAWGAADGMNRHPYILLNYLEGSTDIPVAAVEKCIGVMAAELVTIHDAMVDSLPQLPMRVDPRPELLDFLPEDEEWQGLRSILTKMGSTVHDGNVVLLHGDYWPRNIVWKGETFVGILDWEDAAVGDPLSDVACACLELSYLYGDWGARCFLAAYSKRRPVDPFRFALWQAHVAAAGNASMANWGLEPSRERAMRQIARDSIREAGHTLGA
jgi:aminoglycoside phosphotransferase (APT) family kinase protein